MQRAAMSLFLVAAAASVACSDVSDRPSEIDLLSLLPTAERRAVGNVDESVRTDVVGVGSDTRTALVLRAPARVTWQVSLPLHARLTSSLRLLPGQSADSPGVTLRIGMSDQRKYTELMQVQATGAWAPITLDLREFSEWKFSLFDQPLRKVWRLIVNADARPGGTIALERPRLTKS
jgi:hypothetical protein